MAQTGAPTWEVTSQQERTMPGPDGRLVSGVVVAFRTAVGNNGTVFIPDATYSPNEAARKVGERAAVMDAVSGLTS